MTIASGPPPEASRRSDGSDASDLNRATVEAVLQSIFDPLVVLRAVRDESGRVVDFEYVEANQAAIEINHTTRDELIGSRLLTLLPGHLESGLFDYFVHTVETGEPLAMDHVTYANEILGADGHWDVRAVKVGDAISYTWRDVTERFTESQRYRLLAENTSDIVSVSRPGGAITWVSGSLTAMIGWTPEDVIGHEFNEFVHPDDIDQVRAVQQRLRDGGRHDLTARVRCADASYRWVTISVRDVVDSLAETIRVSSWRDASAEVIARERLVESERRFQLLAENASDVVMMTNPSGVIVWISPSVVDVLGWAPEDVVGTLSVDLIAEQDRETLLGWRAIVYTGRDVHGKKIRYRSASGDWRWMQLHAHPVRDQSGVVTAAVVGLRDCQMEVVAERAFDTLSAAGRILVHAEDETSMLKAMCQAAVDEGGYAFAWYARAEHDERRSMSIVATSRQHADYAEVVKVTWGDGPNADAPMGRAVRLAKTIVVDDLRRDTWASPWRAVTDAHQFRSVIVVPVVLEGSVDGVLVVYAAEVGGFGPNEVTLFEDLAHEVEFGILRLREQAQLVASQREQNLLTRVIEQAGESILMTDADGRIVYVNPTLLRTSGYELDELIGENPAIFQGGLAEWPSYEELWSSLEPGESWRGPMVSRRKNGELYEEEATITPITDETDLVSAYVAVKRDVTAERTLEAALTREQRDRAATLAIMRDVRAGDTLDETAGAFVRAAVSLENVDAVAVLLVERDGHLRPVGSAGSVMPGFVTGKALGTIDSTTMLDRARVGPWWTTLADPPRSMNEALVADWRAHGYVAAIVVPISDDDHLIGLLLFASKDPAAPTWLDGRVSTCEQLGTFVGTLVGSQVDYYDRTERLRAKVDDIIAARRFCPVFQPFVDLVTGRVVGYEALTRFDDDEAPERRFLAAHSVGLGPALEAICVEAAIDAARSLPRDLWLSVNFSPAAIVDGTAASTVAGSNRAIVIEITEHAIVEDYGAVRRAIASMDNVRLAVDDAGAGFTSLTHIIELDPAFVKLDISIVRDIDHDRVRQSMAAAMYYFAAESDATIIAEGVETDAEAETLRAIGASISAGRLLGQGFLFGRPETLG